VVQKSYYPQFLKFLWINSLEKHLKHDKATQKPEIKRPPTNLTVIIEKSERRK